MPAAMVNLLGDLWAGGEPRWDAALRLDPGVSLHLYGKQSRRPGRKMGHLTVLDPDPRTRPGPGPAPPGEHSWRVIEATSRTPD